jgi:ABC-type transporter Mla subunit MlaD
VYTKHAEFKAGLTVLAALVVFLGFLFYAGGADSLWAQYRFVHMRFKAGPTAPVKGDPVLMNGFSIGRIDSVVQAEEIRRGSALTMADRAALHLDATGDGAAREIFVRAVARLDKAQQLPVGTTGEISTSITGRRVLQLKLGFSTDNLRDEDTVSHPILVVAAGDFADLQRSVSDLSDKIGALVDKGGLVVDKVGAALDDVRGLLASIRAKVDVIDAKGIQDNVLAATGSLRDTLASVQKRVDEIADKLSSAAGNVDAMTGRGKEVVDQTGRQLAVLLDDLRKLVADMDLVVGDVRPKVNTILDNVIAVSASAAKLGKDVEGLGPKLDNLVTSAGARLDQVLVRLAEVGHNLADVSEDLRAHPWKLLNKPEEKQIAYENLRNAASNFVRASGEVQQSILELKSLEARRDLVPAEQSRLVTAALARLEADLAKYAQSEAFFTQLLRGGAQSMPGK